MDLDTLQKRLGLNNREVASRARELARLADLKLGAGLGAGQICKNAACLELACTERAQEVDIALLTRMSGATSAVYKQTKNRLQKALGVKTRVGARELCTQFGCVRLEGLVMSTLRTYKERFLKQLQPAQQLNASFDRPVFLVTVFYLIAKKEKVTVEKSKLLQPLGIESSEFASTLASVESLCADLTGTVLPKKKYRKAVPSADAALAECTNTVEEPGASGCDSDEEVLEEGMPGHGVLVNKKRQRQRDFDAWKEQVGSLKTGKEGGKSKKLKQASLSFG